MRVSKKKKSKKTTKHFRFSNNTVKIIMYAVIASFALSMFYTGYSRNIPDEEPQQESSQALNNYLYYDVEQVSPQKVPAILSEKTNQVKLVLKKRFSSEEDVVEVLNQSIEGVSNVRVESSPSRDMVNYVLSDPDAKERILDEVSIQGGYVAYDVYKGTVSGVPVEVIGNGLNASEDVEVYLVERQRSGFKDYIGFIAE